MRPQAQCSRSRARWPEPAERGEVLVGAPGDQLGAVVVARELDLRGSLHAAAGTSKEVGSESGAVTEPVEGSGAEQLVGEGVAPLGEAEVGGDDGGAAPVVGEPCSYGWGRADQRIREPGSRTLTGERRIRQRGVEGGRKRACT